MTLENKLKFMKQNSDIERDLIDNAEIIYHILYELPVSEYLTEEESKELNEMLTKFTHLARKMNDLMSQQLEDMDNYYDSSFIIVESTALMASCSGIMNEISDKISKQQAEA